MKTLRRWLRILVVMGALMMLAGCALGLRSRPTCGVILLMNGVAWRPSPAEFAAIEPALAVAIGQEGMVLVRDVAASDYVAHVEYTVDEADPSKGSLHVHKVVSNGFTPLAARPRGPSTEMERALAHDASMSGASAFPKEFRDPMVQSQAGGN